VVQSKHYELLGRSDKTILLGGNKTLNSTAALLTAYCAVV